MICPLLANHPNEVATAFNRLLIHAGSLSTYNPRIVQQVRASQREATAMIVRLAPACFLVHACTLLSCTAPARLLLLAVLLSK